MRFNNIDIHSEHDSELTEIIRTESAHVIDMFLRLIKYYDNSRCKKLIISCDEKATRPHVRSARNGYVFIQMPFDRPYFLSLTPKEKSAFYLNLISRSIILIGEPWGWNLEYFNFIQKSIISSRFRNQWNHGKPSVSPNPEKSAYLRVVQTIEEARILLIISEKKKVTRKIQVAATQPTFWNYRRYLGQICWKSDSHLEILDMEGEPFFESSSL